MPSPITTEVDGGDGAPSACPLPMGAASDADNCQRYCAGYGCTACPSLVGKCEQLCKALDSKGTLDAPCLACAVDNEGAIVSRLSCESFVSAGPNGPEFTIVYPVRECGAVCKLPAH
jgi:hypothetical protein